MSQTDPSINGEVPRPERDARGLFLPGNRVSKGHPSPHAGKVQALRSALFREITPDRWREIIHAMHKEAVGVWDTIEGKWTHRPSVRCAEWISDRLIGKPTESGDEERLKRIEQALGLDDSLSPERIASILADADAHGERDAEEPG